MASSKVQMASAHFSCVLRDHNWRHRDKERESNNNNVRAQQQQKLSLEKNLKVLVRDHLHSRIDLSGSRGSVFASDENNSGNQVENREKKDHSFTSLKSTRRRDEEEEEEAQVEVEDDESAAPLARKQSRVIDRWATRQAREINTTLERQTHERELMALSNSHPVSTVASTFLADSPRATTESPRAPSESSVDLPNLHASSLVRMWRDLEAESKLTSGNNGNLSFNSDSTIIISNGDRLNSGSGTSNIDNASSVEEDPSPRSEVCDSGDERFETPPAQEDSFADWDSEQNTLSTPRERENRECLSSSQVQVQRVSDVGESEKLRVVDIIRRLTLGKPIKTRSSSINSSSMDETEDRELPTVIDPEPEQQQQQQREQRRTGFVKIAAGKSPRLRGRQAMMSLLKQMERERQRELNQLAERRAVSRFPQRGRIQSMLKLRFLQRLAASQYQQRPPLEASELGSLQPATSIFALRQKFSANKYAGDVHGEESRDSSNSHTQLPNDSKDSEYSGASNLLANEEVRQQMGTTEQESTLPVHHSIPSAGEAPQEEDHSSDRAWQGRILLGSTLVQELSINTATTSRALEGSGASEKPETDTQQLARFTNGTWLDDLSHPRRDWRGSVQSWCQDLLSNNSENGEINVAMDELEPSMQELAGGGGSHSQDWRHARQEWYEDALENKSEDGERNFVVADQQSDVRHLEGSTDRTWLDDGAYPQTYWSEQSWYLQNNSENGEMNATDEQDPDSEHLVGSINGNWQRNVSRPTRDWRRSRQERYQEMLENRSENGEIQKLLQRRSVSNFLASDLRETMDQMIKSCLQRQSLRLESIAGEENHFERPHLGASDSSYRFASPSFNLPLSTSYNLPLPSQLRTHNWYQDLEVMENSDQVPSSQSTSVQPFPSHCQDNPQSAIIHPSVEMDLISDLRAHILQLHNEIFELRRSVVSCLDMQNNLQHSIKKEVSAAVYNSVHGGEAIELFDWVPIRKGKCCICYEMQVDSLLYRCGHMCTCFNCAHELQWSSGRCPICRAPILDVVRAYSDA